MKVMAVEPELVTWTGRVAVAPTSSEPKLRLVGENVSGDGAAVTKSEMNSSEVEESLAISSEAMRVPAVWGLALTMMEQVAAGTMVAQALWRVKSAEVKREATWMVTLPVLVRVTVCVGETSPTTVEGKLRELCESVKVASGPALLGLVTARGAAWPVKLTMLGLEAASLSMMSEPASEVVAGEDVPLTTWLEGT